MRDWKFNHIDFSIYPVHTGNDLGVFWTPEKTTIKIWAPTAKIVEFRLYKDGMAGDAYHKTQLQAGENGTWSTVLTGDYEGKYYTLRINDGNWLNETPDIYTRCVGVNGLRGQIFNPRKTNPDNWEHDQSPRYESYTEAIIYEAHVRDFSVSPNSGIHFKGKFLGFTEEGTQNETGNSTGLSHLKELGITHVHLLPVYDFYTVDEEKPDEKYNWGYDPLHNNSPEGSYSTNPYDGTVRLKELKMLVQALHNAGIGVIFDVVYNHTYFTKSSAFNQTVPGYFYRQKTDGTFANASGCGNEVATERAMVRKYIVNSLKYWKEEFHADGFRFDLMGIYDLETMQVIREELDKIEPGTFLYGEGWAADQSPMPAQKRAIKTNTPLLPGVASFNDDFRNALKGDNGNKKSKGFVSGLELREEAVKFGVVGAVPHPQIVYDYVGSTSEGWASQPAQCINYASCHDNYTLWDKLKFSCPKASDDEMRKMVKLAGALVLTSQGVPFLHAGIEFCRTKKGNGNSYKSTDAINQIDWNQKNEYLDVFEYFRQLIELRKKHPAFRMSAAEQIRQNIQFCTEYKPGIVSYCIDGEKTSDPWGKIVMIFNGNRKEVAVKIPEGEYQIMGNGTEIYENGTGEFISGEINIEAISMLILTKKH